MNLPDPSDPAWVCLVKLLNLRWFSRLWTLQEVAVSADVHVACGSNHCHWDDLLRARYLLGDAEFRRKATGLVTTYVTYAARERHLRGLSHSMLQLLYQTTVPHACTDARDKIYALLGLQSPANNLAIIPDYKMTAPEVYITAAAAILTQTSSLQILGLASDRPDSDPNLPSWVPDWRVSHLPYPLDSFRNAKFNACRGVPYQPAASSKHDQLLVRGRVVDFVQRVAGNINHKLPRYRSDISAYLGRDNLLPLLYHSIQQHSSYHRKLSQDEHAIEKCIMRTLTADGMREPKFDGPIQDTNLVTMWNALHENEEQKDRDELIRRLWNQTLPCSDRSFLLLRTHVIALGPQTCKKGDLVCVLHGSSVPHILRPQDKYYRYVGECYVDGIMYGEAIGDDEEDYETLILV